MQHVDGREGIALTNSWAKRRMYCVLIVSRIRLHQRGYFFRDAAWQLGHCVSWIFKRYLILYVSYRVACEDTLYRCDPLDRELHLHAAAGEQTTSYFIAAKNGEEACLMQNFGDCLVTRSMLVAELSHVGVQHGDVLCVHVALSQLGYVCGGARTIIEGLLDAVGPAGTIMMPTYTRDTADPREWQYPPAPAGWLDRLVAETPAYDPVRTPTQNVGAVAELFRTYPNVLRSGHPVSSVAATGPKARSLTADAPLQDRFGEDSPYGRLVRMGGKVVMLGAPYETMSLMHLSQYRLGWGERIVKSACMLIDGQRQWVQFEDFRLPHTWAGSCVADMVAAGVARRRLFGDSYLLLVDAAAAVDFTVSWRRSHNC